MYNLEWVLWTIAGSLIKDQFYKKEFILMECTFTVTGKFYTVNAS